MDKKALFIDKIQKEFPVKHTRVLQHLYQHPPVTFRVNTSKISEKEALTGYADGCVDKTGHVFVSF